MSVPVIPELLRAKVKVFAELHRKTRYADDLFNTLFRLEAKRMKEHGYECGTTGRSSFIQDGVLETITKVEAANNACSKAKSTSAVRRKPRASPFLFAEFLMQLCAFVFLDDISGEHRHTGKPI